MHHTYLNSSGWDHGAESSADVPDNDFLTDSNVYYNLPPPPLSVHSRSAIPFTSGGYSASQWLSCSSSSPKILTSGELLPCKSNTPTGSHHHHAPGEKLHGKVPNFPLKNTNMSQFFPSLPEKMVVKGKGGKSIMCGEAAVAVHLDKVSTCVTSLLSPSCQKEHKSKCKNKKLEHTRSFDLDHLYQNLIRVTSKPRSNSFSVPWKRKKKGEHASSLADFNDAIVSTNEKEDCKTSITSVVVDNGFLSTDTVFKVKEKTSTPTSFEPYIDEGRAPPNISLTGTLPDKTNSKSSNSSRENRDAGSEEGIIDDYAAEICPGIRCLREGCNRNYTYEISEECLNSCYHPTATLPRQSSNAFHNNKHSHDADVKGSNKHHEDLMGSVTPDSQKQITTDVMATIEEWRHKERWLEKKRTSRSLRQTEENGEAHITIFYAEDGAHWKSYLYELFTKIVPKDEEYQAMRVEEKNVEEIEEAVGGLEAIKLKEARLQIVIISPRFMSHIEGHGRSEIGQLFEPEKVLGLLLGVNDSQFSMVHLSALYSYKDWQHLKVRNSDLNFVEEVLCAAINILNNSKLYLDCPDERAARFKITSRKITVGQKQVYILLNEEAITRDTIEILIEAPGKSSTAVSKYHLLNPYTVVFSMPEEFLKTSSLLKITLLVNGKNFGSRQLKCENHLDTLRDILASVSNPTELMCQALNINPICDELDQKLADKVKLRLPLRKMEEPSSENDGTEFPTWIHFSAYYGLERLTWALLEIPGAVEALNTFNCNGYTPSVLAYQKGFYSLAQKLEDASLLALATPVCHIPKELEIPREPSVSDETYNDPPSPRSSVSLSNTAVISTYDILPAPRTVNSDLTIPEEITPSISEATCPVQSTTSHNLQDSEDCQDPTSSPVTSDNAHHLPLSPVPFRQKTKYDEEQSDCYLDMNVLCIDRHGKLYGKSSSSPQNG